MNDRCPTCSLDKDSPAAWGCETPDFHATPAKSGARKALDALVTLAGMAQRGYLDAKEVQRSIDERKATVIAEIGRLTAENAALRAQISELQSSTKNEATALITEYIPWQRNNTHPRRVVLEYIDTLQAEIAEYTDHGFVTLPAFDQAIIERDGWNAKYEDMKIERDDWEELAGVETSKRLVLQSRIEYPDTTGR